MATSIGANTTTHSGQLTSLPSLRPNHVLPPFRCHNLTLAELSLVNEPSEVVATLVTTVEIMERVVTEVVVGGRGVALHARNTCSQSLSRINTFMTHILQLANAHQDGLQVELILNAHTLQERM